MPEYSGRLDESIFSTHGWVVNKGEAHERANFKVIDGRVYGYVPVREKISTKTPGNVNIEKLGAERGSAFAHGVDVIWFANNPAKPSDAYIVGWYRNAKVFKDIQYIEDQDYRVQCKAEDATLIGESSRTFHIPHVRSLVGQKLGYGYGQSSLWYAEGADEFVKQVATYIDSVERASVRVSGTNANAIGDAINDLDDYSVGSQTPERREFSGTFIVRDNRIRHKVVVRSQGKCEYCGELGFERTDGSHFVEAHHIISLADQGPDTMANVIALCPNHHRRAHFGNDREQLEAAFLDKLSEVRGR